MNLTRFSIDMRQSFKHATLACVGVTLCALVAGCVTERPNQNRGVPVPAARADMPNSPVAKPATNASSLTARTQVALKPMGVVQYDGQRLPLASPDARFIAVQVGESPTWPAVLAEPGAEPPVCAIKVYDLTGAAVRLIDAEASLPTGCLLGRSADGTGFLVERLKPDGSRAIGKVEWLTGQVRWLADDASINAHGVLLPGGGFVFSRRGRESDAWQLVLRTAAGESIATPESGVYVMPMTAATDDVAYAIQLDPKSLTLVTLRIEKRSAGPTLGSVIARRVLSNQSSLLGAFQLAQLARPARAFSAHDGADGATALLMMDPRANAMSVFDPSSGIATVLAPRSMAAAAGPDVAQPGYFCTTPQSLTFVPAKARGSTAQGAPVLDEPFVPIASMAGQSPELLIVGPVRNQPDRLSIVRLMLLTGER